MTRHDDRNRDSGRAPDRRREPHRARRRVAAISPYESVVSWFDRARHVVDAPMEFRHAVVEIERDVGEVARFTLEQRDDAVDRV